jgi:hypothetical protein
MPMYADVPGKAAPEPAIPRRPAVSKLRIERPRQMIVRPKS